jgi:hypothetical protein
VFGVGPTLVWKDNASTWRLVAGALAVVAFTMAVLLGIARNRGRPRSGLLLAWLVWPVLLPAVVSLLASPLFHTRYIILASIPFYLFAGAGLISLPRQGRVVAVAGMALVMLLSQASYFASPIKHQWREAAAYVESRRRPGDALAFDIDYNEAAYAHYAPPRSAADLRVRLVDAPAAEPRPGTGARLFGATAQGSPAADQTDTLLGRSRVWLFLADAPAEAAARDRAFFTSHGWVAVETITLKGIGVTAYERRAR